jgi:hypothetical protein
MEMPKLNQQHQTLHRLAGKWIGEETMHPSPFGPGGKAIGLYDNRVACNGFFVVSDYDQITGNKLSYTGHAIFGVDPATQETTWYWVDTMGFPPPSPARGKWDGDTLVLIGRDGKDQIHGRYTYAFEGDGRLRFKLENTQDGGKSWHPFMEGSYTKA